MYFITFKLLPEINKLFMSKTIRDRDTATINDRLGTVLYGISTCYCRTQTQSFSSNQTQM